MENNMHLILVNFINEFTQILLLLNIWSKLRPMLHENGSGYAETGTYILTSEPYASIESRFKKNLGSVCISKYIYI